MSFPTKARLAALALNNMGISCIYGRHDEQSRSAFEDALKMIMGIVESYQTKASDHHNSHDSRVSPSPFDAIMKKACSAMTHIKEITRADSSESFSSDFDIILVDDIAWTAQKAAEGICKVSSNFLIRMELEGVLIEECEKADPVEEAAVILYNFASVYKFLATTESVEVPSLQRRKRLERAFKLLQLSFSLIGSNLMDAEAGPYNSALEPLPFSILILQSLVMCSAMLARTHDEQIYSEKLSILQTEFLTQEKIFMNSSCRMAPAA